MVGFCLVGWLGCQPVAQAQTQHPDEPARPTTQRLRPVAKTAAVSGGASTNPNARVDDNLQQLYQESANLRRSAPGKHWLSGCHFNGARRLANLTN